MTHGAYYSEHDRFAAEWLRKLIAEKLIADGEVDERDIQQVQPEELRGFTQCHFFAGIGVWSYALRAAGWPDGARVWTGSCPCQSFSASGKRRGFSDHRHLWPTWFRLISECKPDICFGEQVASKDGLAWLDIVSADMEGADYAFGTADTCAAGYGAPMLSQRLYFVAEANCARELRRFGKERTATTESKTEVGLEDGQRFRDEHRRSGATSLLESSTSDGLSRRPSEESIEPSGTSSRPQEQRPGYVGELGQTDSSGLQGCGPEGSAERRETSERSIGVSGGAVRGLWRDAEWIYCRDERMRPIEPCTFPLAYGTPNRVGRLRGYGNALCAEQAKGFIEAYLETKFGDELLRK